MMADGPSGRPEYTNKRLFLLWIDKQEYIVVLGGTINPRIHSPTTHLSKFANWSMPKKMARDYLLNQFPMSLKY